MKARIIIDVDFGPKVDVEKLIRGHDFILVLSKGEMNALKKQDTIILKSTSPKDCGFQYLDADDNHIYHGGESKTLIQILKR